MWRMCRVEVALFRDEFADEFHIPNTPSPTPASLGPHHTSRRSRTGREGTSRTSSSPAVYTSRGTTPPWRTSSGSRSSRGTTPGPDPLYPDPPCPDPPTPTPPAPTPPTPTPRTQGPE